MTNLPPNLEALMPEPSFRLKWIEPLAAYRVSKPNIGDADCYTATQMREAILAATERAAKKEHIHSWRSEPNQPGVPREVCCCGAMRAGAASTGRGEGREGA